MKFKIDFHAERPGLALRMAPRIFAFRTARHRGCRVNSRGLRNVLLVGRSCNVKILLVRKAQILRHGRGHLPVRCIGITGNLEMPRGGRCHRASNISARIRHKIFRHHRRRSARQRIHRHISAHRRRSVIEIHQQICRRRKVAVRVVHVQRDHMRLAIAQHPRERRQVHAIGTEVQRLDARNRPPQIGVNASGINPRIHRRHARRHAVDRNLRLAERGSRTALQQPGNIVRNAGIPELIRRLALRVHVKIGALYIRRKSKGLRQLIRCRKQGHGLPSWTRGQRQYLVGRLGSAVRFVSRIELQLRRSIKNTGIGGVHHVPQVSFARARRIEQRAIFRQIPLHMPLRAHRPPGFRRGSKINIGAAQPDVHRPVKLPPGGHAHIHVKNHFRPGAGTSRRSRKRKRLRGKVRKSRILEKLHNAGRSART